VRVVVTVLPVCPDKAARVGSPGPPTITIIYCEQSIGTDKVA
jgi:hypothetical protein